MKREKIIQLWQFVLGWILVWMFVVFVVKDSFLDFVLRYRVYLLIVSVSYFYYYSIEYEVDKKYDKIRSIIIRWNVYLFAHIFFRPLLNIPHELFILLWLIVWWIYGTTKMKSKRKWILQVTWVMISFFILISGRFYLYPDAPDIEWFINARNYQLSVYWVSEPVEKREAYIQITNDRKSEDFAIVSNLRKSLWLDIKISYMSVRRSRSEKVLILSPWWDVVWIYPQSEVELQFMSRDKLKVSKLAWRVWFGSWIFGWNIEYVGDLEEDDSSSDLLDRVKYEYLMDLTRHLHNQIDSEQISFANTEIMQKADGALLRFLARIFPTTFGQNLSNYNEFQKYFDMVEDDKKIQRDYEVSQTWWDSWWLRNNLKNGISIGRKNIRFL